MPNKEQIVFKRVIKKRRKRALRKLHPKPKFKWVAEPKILIAPKRSWWTKFWNWIFGNKFK